MSKKQIRDVLVDFLKMSLDNCQSSNYMNEINEFCYKILWFSSVVSSVFRK